MGMIMTKHNLPLIERFMIYVQPDLNSGCWLWSGTVDGAGYGRLSFPSGYKLAHRLSMRLHGRPLDDGQMACHHCDTPGCVNPDHLYAGSPADNMNDKVRRGRARGCHSGEAHHNSRYSDATVAVIREMHQTGMTQRDISIRLNIPNGTICRYVNKTSRAA